MEIFELKSGGVTYYFVGNRLEIGEKYVHDREFKGYFLDYCIQHLPQVQVTPGMANYVIGIDPIGI